MKKEVVVIIIPTYNEAEVILETLEALEAVKASLQEFELQVLVFDSASTDKTTSLVASKQTNYPWLHLRVEPQKSGLGSAYLQAMKIALDELSADIVMEFDADLSHQPCYIAPILERIKTCDVVIGSRYVRGGSIPSNWGWHRKCLSVLGNAVARWVLTPRYKDFTSGFRATRRAVLQAVLPEAFLTNHYGYKLHLLWLLHQAKARILEFPIVFVDREKGHSKLPTNSIVDSLRVVMTLRFYELKRYIKMCVIGVVGLVIQLLVYQSLRSVLPPFNASQLAVLAAIINNFYFNNRFTFKHKSPYSTAMKVKRISLFIVYSVFMIQLQSYWLDWGIDYLGRGLLKENFLVLSGVVIGSLLNYFMYSRVFWRAKRRRLSSIPLL